MHVLHFIAVESDCPDQAFNKVSNSLESDPSSWSDWHTVGMGRFGQGKGIISYNNNKDLFLKKLDWAKECRKQEMKDLLNDLDAEQGQAQFFINATDFILKGEGKILDMVAYRINCITNLLMNTWNSKSYFYDLEGGSVSCDYLLERIEQNPEDQFLIPVDFHF